MVPRVLNVRNGSKPAATLAASLGGKPALAREPQHFCVYEGTAICPISYHSSRDENAPLHLFMPIFACSAFDDLLVASLAVCHAKSQAAITPFPSDIRPTTICQPGIGVECCYPFNAIADRYLFTFTVGELDCPWATRSQCPHD